MASKPLLPPPSVGEILWCRFPELPRLNPGPKPRPCLVLKVSDPPKDPSNPYRVQVVYATSRVRGQPLAHEADIDPVQHPKAFKASGLAYPTRFDFSTMVVLTYDSDYFVNPPRVKGLPPALSPLLGVLHATRIREFHLAAQAGIAKARKDAAGSD